MTPSPNILSLFSFAMETLLAKNVKFFIASSFELYDDREAITALVAGLNHTLNKWGINFSTVRWEFLSSAWADGRKQDEYNRELQACDMCLVLFWTSRGPFTNEELNIAYQMVKDSNGVKKLYVFFRDITEQDKIDKKLSDVCVEDMKSFKDSCYNSYKNWANSYGHIDTLKMEILRNLIIFLFEDMPAYDLFPIVNGRIDIGGKTVIDLMNIPFYGNNEGYNRICSEIEKTKDLLSLYKPEDPKYSKYAQELTDLSQNKERMEKGIWETALEISKLKSRQSSERLNRAIELFENGDSKGAEAVLKEEEIARDVANNKEMIQNGEEQITLGRQGLQSNLEEYLLKIKLLLDEMADGWQEKVRSLYEMSFEIGEENLENKKYIKLLTRFGSFCNLVGDSKTALKNYELALNYQISLLGENHPDIAASYNNVGSTYCDLGDHTKALEYYEKALSICKAIFGENHPSVATLYDNMGCTYGELGDHTKALEYQEKALSIRKALFGENHSSVAISYNNVGGTYGDLGDHTKALEYLEKALSIQKTLFGDNHPDVAISYDNMGYIYGVLGDHTKALEYHERALSILKSLFDENHPYVASSYNNVGYILGKLGGHSKALEYKEKALSIRKALFDENHPDVATSYNNVGYTYGELGDHTKALEYQEKALSILKGLFGVNHPKVAASYDNVGRTYGALGDYSKALEYQEKALSIRKALFGENHSSVAKSYNNVGYTYEKLGAHEKALEYQEKARVILSEINKGR